MVPGQGTICLNMQPVERPEHSCHDWTLPGSILVA